MLKCGWCEEILNYSEVIYHLPMNSEYYSYDLEFCSKECGRKYEDHCSKQDLGALSIYVGQDTYWKRRIICAANVFYAMFDTKELSFIYNGNGYAYEKIPTDDIYLSLEYHLDSVPFEDNYILLKWGRGKYHFTLPLELLLEFVEDRKLDPLSEVSYVNRCNYFKKKLMEKKQSLVR